MFGDAHCLGMDWAMKSYIMSQCGASSLPDETNFDHKTQFLTTGLNTYTATGSEFDKDLDEKLERDLEK